MKKEVPDMRDYMVRLCKYVASFLSSYPSFDMEGESVRAYAFANLKVRTEKPSPVEEMADSQF
jgi:hypothetical protein